MAIGMSEDQYNEERWGLAQFMGASRMVKGAIVFKWYCVNCASLSALIVKGDDYPRICPTCGDGPVEYDDH